MCRGHIADNVRHYGHVPDIMQITISVPDVYRTYSMCPGCVRDKAWTCLERLVSVP